MCAQTVILLLAQLRLIHLSPLPFSLHCLQVRPLWAAVLRKQEKRSSDKNIVLIHGVSGFTCLTGQSSVQTCSLSATSVTLSGGICHGSALQDNILIIPTTAATINSSPASIAGGITYLAIQETAIYAPLIQLVWQASDLTETTSTSSTSSTSTTISPSIPGPTQSPALPGGLSTGVKAAIGISVSVGVIAAIALAAFILIRRRRGATTSSAPPVFSSSRGQPEREMYGLQRESELTGVPIERHELSAGVPLLELPSTSPEESNGESFGGRRRL